MRKPLSWLLIVGFAAAAAGCGKSAARAAPIGGSDAQSPVLADPQPRERLAIQLIAAQALAAPPRNDPAPSAQPAPPPTGDPAADPPGFRLTVPLCRRAERLDDPLAKTPECAQLLQAARDQAEACRKAFETGDDKAALSPACRQAAGFR
jgi:hypothetical protein